MTDSLDRFWFELAEECQQARWDGMAWLFASFDPDNDSGDDSIWEDG